MRGTAQAALTLLVMFVALSLIVGGPRGGRWALRTIWAPVGAGLNRRVSRIVAALVAILLLYLIGVGILAP